MDQKATDLRRRWLDEATEAKRHTGLPDQAIVGAMLSAAHGFALRRDPTPRYIESLFEPSDGAAA